MRFVDFSTDVLLYLLVYLELGDALLLLSTCTHLRKLSDNRSLWINVLQRIQSNGSRPLACPMQQDFSQLSLSELQRIARHTVRLEKNWSRKNPRIIGAVSAIQCEGIHGHFWLLTVIPGTNILVLHSVVSGAFCYDLPTATSSPPQRIGEVYCLAYFHEHRKFFIAVVHVIENVYQLDVLCVEYGPGAPQILRRVYQRIQPAPNMRNCVDVFMRAEIVGIIYTESTSEELCLLAINIQTDASIKILLSGLSDLIRPFVQPILWLSCFLQGSYVYISVQTKSCTCHLFRCNISSPWDDVYTNARFDPSPSLTIESFDAGLARTGRFRPTPCHLHQPLGGFLALYTDTYWYPIRSTIRFQPDIITPFRKKDTLRLTLPGGVHRSHQYGSSTYSGNYLLLCTALKNEDHDNEAIYVQSHLHLVHFVKGPPASMTVRELKMPYFIESELLHDRIHSMVVDDHLGVLYLTREGGYIFAVPFA